MGTWVVVHYIMVMFPLIFLWRSLFYIEDCPAACHASETALVLIWNTVCPPLADHFPKSLVLHIYFPRALGQPPIIYPLTSGSGAVRPNSKLSQLTHGPTLNFYTHWKSSVRVLFPHPVKLLHSLKIFNEGLIPSPPFNFYMHISLSVSCHCSIWRKPKMLENSSNRGFCKRVFEHPYRSQIQSRFLSPTKVAAVILHRSLHGFSSSYVVKLHSGQMANSWS